MLNCNPLVLLLQPQLGVSFAGSAGDAPADASGGDATPLARPASGTATWQLG